MKTPEGSTVVKSKVARIGAVLGLIASLIAIVGFTTGAFTWAELKRRMWQASQAPQLGGDLELQPAPPSLSLRIIANVAHAAIYLNGESVGATPGDIKANSGRNEIMVVRPGCSAERQQVETNDIRSRLLRFNLDCENAWLTDHPAILRDVGKCPFEGCVYREWLVTQSSVARLSPRQDAARVFSLKSGEWVTAVTGEVVTRAPGLAVLNERLRKYCGKVEIQLRSGDSLHLYTYRGEGTWLAFYSGEPCADIAIDESEIVKRPVTEWWVQVVNASGSIGWVLANKNFDNWDLLS